MKSVKFLAIAALMLGAFACGNNNSSDQEAAIVADSTCCSEVDCVVGSWEQPVPGMEGQTQGIKFEKDGIASSINMATLVFEKWNKQGDTLVLSGKSIGNGLTSDFADTLTISKLSKDTLVLTSNGEVVWSLIKTACDSTSCACGTDSTCCK